MIRFWLANSFQNGYNKDWYFGCLFFVHIGCVVFAKDKPDSTIQNELGNANYEHCCN